MKLTSASRHPRRLDPLLQHPPDRRVGRQQGQQRLPALQRRRRVARGFGGDAQVEQGQRVVRLGLLQPLQHGDGLRRRDGAGCELAHMRLGPVGQDARVDGGQRVGAAVGVGGVGVLAQHLPGIGQAQPAGAVLRRVGEARGQPLDHGADRLLALLRRELGHRLLLLAAGPRRGGVRRRGGRGLGLEGRLRRRACGRVCREIRRIIDSR